MSDTEDERGRRKLAVVVLVIAAVLVAWFLSVHHDIDVEVEGEGSVDPMGATVGHLGSAEFRIVPADGWRIAAVELDGEPVETDGGVLRLERVVSDHTVRAVFAEDPGHHTLTVSSNEGGSTDPEGTVTARSGETVAVRISADEGYVVEDIILDGVSRGSSNRMDVVMDSDHSLQVVFRRAVDDPDAGGHADPWVMIDVDVQVETTGADYGYVDPSGRVRVAYGGSLTVEIHLNDGYSIKRIAVDGMQISPSSIFTVTDITDSIEIGIVLLRSTELRHSVTASASAGGSISPSGTIAVRDGGSIEFALRADPGYHLSRLAVDGRPVDAVGGRYVLSDIRADHDVRAEFSRDGPVGPSLSGITVAGAPSFCYVGETLDVVGMVVTARYSDGSSAAVTGFGMSETSWAAPGLKTVTVSYGGRTASFDVVVPTLASIDVVSDPTRTAYGIGDSFDPAGMVVEATYAEGVQYTRVVDTSFAPSSFDSVGDVPVFLSYTEGSTTVRTSITVKVVYSGGFRVYVESYSGTRVVDGAVESFSSTYSGKRLSEFSFDMSNSVPGITQTVRLRIDNSAGIDTRACVYVSALAGSSELADQVYLTCGSSMRTVRDVAGGVFVDLGTVGSSGAVLELTISFPSGPNNNAVMGHSMSFEIGVFAGQETDRSRMRIM